MMPHENQTPKKNKDLTGIVSEPKPDQKPDLTDQTLKKQQDRDDPTEPEEYHDMMPHENQTSKDIKNLTNIVSEVKPDQKPDLTDQTLKKQQVDRDDPTEPEEQHKPEEHHEMMPHKNQTPKENKDLTGVVSEPKLDQKLFLTDQTLQKQEDRNDPTEPGEHHEMMPHENQTPKDIKNLTNIVSEVKPDQKPDLTDQICQKQQVDRDDPTEPEEQHKPEEHQEMMPLENQTPKENKHLTNIVS